MWGLLTGDDWGWFWWILILTYKLQMTFAIFSTIRTPKTFNNYFPFFIWSIQTHQNSC